ncbi:hypothetical protein Poly41_05380 [Novipirellula artificiosorum]|uniref:Uncharacterized protein n=1 Tax=Novipirellula artificiosorum TaxID=2528016 RepID=A0A5C6E047_9BACT|nr:hypothetical protein Poly41_05380 [Novipirellula artificiosorum]
MLNWRASRRVEARLAPLREVGKPISIQDLQPSEVGEELNAAKAVERYADELRSFDRQLAEATRDSVTDDQFDEGSMLVAKSIVQEFSELNEALRKASRLPAYQPDLDYSHGPSPFMDQLIDQEISPRTITRALYGHGLMSLADGKTDDAVEDAIAILRWSDHVARQPLLLNHLVGTALYMQGIQLSGRCLYAGDASPAAREMLLQACSNESKLLANYEMTLDTERAFGISSFDSFPGSRFMLMLGELAAYLDVVSEFQSFSEKPTGIAPDQPTSASIFAGSSWSALQQGLVSLRRKQALSRTVRILAAWQDAGGEIGTTLTELDLPEAVTTDPYDGSQMKWKGVGDTIAIYSVGRDMIDDEGSIEDGRDIGIEP